MAEYKIDKSKDLPYPRVAYICQCGFQMAVLEGYEWDTTQDTGGNNFSTRSNRLALPKGVCMGCLGAIFVAGATNGR